MSTARADRPRQECCKASNGPHACIHFLFSLSLSSTSITRIRTKLWRPFFTRGGAAVFFVVARPENACKQMYEWRRRRQQQQ